MAYNTKNIKKDASGQPVPQGFNETTDDFEVLKSKDGAMLTQLSGSNVKAADKGTAGTADQSISVSFNHIDIVNDGPNELILSIDESSLTSAKKIYIAPGEPYEKNLAGTSLHYSVASGSSTFRYVLS